MVVIGLAVAHSCRQRPISDRPRQLGVVARLAAAPAVAAEIVGGAVERVGGYGAGLVRVGEVDLAHLEGDEAGALPDEGAEGAAQAHRRQRQEEADLEDERHFLLHNTENCIHCNPFRLN